MDHGTGRRSLGILTPLPLYRPPKLRIRKEKGRAPHVYDLRVVVSDREASVAWDALDLRKLPLLSHSVKQVQFKDVFGESGVNEEGPLLLIRISKTARPFSGKKTWT